MKFFQPGMGPRNTDGQKLTGANMPPGNEDRLKAIKEKRKDRREALRDVGSERNTYEKENEALRRNKEMTRTEFRRKERKNWRNLGLRKPDAANEDE